MTQENTPDIIVVGKPLPRLHASTTCLDRLKERETGGVWDGKRTKLLPLGTPALAAYPDDAGVWTIGWGATGKSIFKGVRWTLLECEVRFEADVLSREAAIRAELSRYECSQKQFEALLSFTFNVGNANVGLAQGEADDSTLLRYHKLKDYGSASAQFHRWVYITQNGKKVKARGLELRRSEEAGVYLGGDWRLGE
jgi:lysozyme